MKIEAIPVLSDNYVYLLHEESTGETAAVDPAEAAPVLSFLEQKKWRLTQIWCTHHHSDHIGGNQILLRSFPNCQIMAPTLEGGRFPGANQKVAEGEPFSLGSTTVCPLSVPGHTRDHTAYFLESEPAVFCGDTLFSLGCGRVFCGSHQQLFESLEKLSQLPKETKVYAAHEYTEQNCRFALSVEKDNEALKEKMAWIQDRRRTGQMTLPSTIGEERKLNPFVKAKAFEAFKRLRDLKDRF